MGAALAAVAKGAATRGAAKAFREMAKIKPRQWKEMAGAFKEMSDFAKQGGVAKFIGGTIGTIKSKIENQVIGMFSPVINEISQFTGDLLEEATPLGNALGDLIRLLSDLKIQIGDVNVSLLDVLLGFPLLLKALNGFLSLLEAPVLTEEQEQDIVDIFFPGGPGGHGDYDWPPGSGYGDPGSTGAPGGTGPGAGFGGYQEF